MARPKKIKPELSTSEIMALPQHEGVPIREVEPASATVTFIGDPRGGQDPDQPEYGGKSFPKGKAVPVDADWLKANGNVRRNNHFRVE